MPNLPDLLSPIVGVRPSLLFSGLLVVHIAAGAIGYSAGLLAALSPKRAGRHPRVGGVYYWALAVIFVTATGMSVLRWPEDAYLFVLGSLSFVSASVGYAARKSRWRGWLSFHIGGMSVSVIVLATAFYVDNGPKFASQVPTPVYWLGPSVVGIPLLLRAFARHARVREDLRATVHAMVAVHAVHAKLLKGPTKALLGTGHWRVPRAKIGAICNPRSTGEDSANRSLGPASRTNTDTDGSSERRPASTAPAEPPPAMA